MTFGLWFVYKNTHLLGHNGLEIVHNAQKSEYFLIIHCTARRDHNLMNLMNKQEYLN